MGPDIPFFWADLLLGEINKFLFYKLIDIIKNDTGYNKGATGYLYKNQPELWQEILDATDF